MDTVPGTPLPPPTPVDPQLQARLDRLAASRARTTQPAATGAATSAPRGRTRKHHAAKRSRAAAVLMSVTATAGLSAYFQHADSVGASSSSTTAPGSARTVGTTAATSTGPATTSAAATGSSSSTTAASTSSSSTATATAALADGTYAGTTATNKYGPVQVQITVAGGRITEAVALQTPSDDHKSVSINNRATPTLASEVLTAQSAQIHTVSGATYTSDSYKTSLQSAIDLARAATATTVAAS